MGLYHKYRPATLDKIVGQEDAVRILNSFITSNTVPHAILFNGPSGCGKTTLARILNKVVQCGKQDFQELNCADFRGIDMVREIRSRMGLAPISGKSRVYLIDECHQLTKDAQTAFLKMLEDTPDHVYFMLATTNPGKLIKTIQNRCTSIKVKAISQKQLCDLVGSVAEQEKVELSDEVIEKIADIADGSARKSLVLLESIIGIENNDEQLEALEKSDHERQSIEICRALLNPRVTWGEITEIIKGIDEEPELLRRKILGYARKVMLGGGKAVSRAFLIIQAFRDDWFACESSGLVAACYEVVSNKN